LGFFAYPRKKVQSRITPPKRSRFRSGFLPIRALGRAFRSDGAYHSVPYRRLFSLTQKLPADPTVDGEDL
jgi:hypothetical protein